MLISQISMCDKEFRFPYNTSWFDLITRILYKYKLEPALSSLVAESESEPEDVAAEVLRPLLHPVQRHHRPRGGDEQRAAARHEDALQVRPEGVLVQAPRLAEGAHQVLAHVQGPGLSGDARGPALRC